MRFNIPYYAQTSEFSCGPACVLMVMKHFTPGLRLTRELEYEVWRQCNMIGIKGADPYGLSVPLLNAHFNVHLTTQWRNSFNRRIWIRRVLRFFTREEAELSLFGMKQNRSRALARRLPVEYERPTVEKILRMSNAKFVPVALVHMGIVHRLNIPHWVVVTNADEDAITFNDPYPPRGRRGLKLPQDRFQKILDDIGTRIGLSPSILFVRKD